MATTTHLDHEKAHAFSVVTGEPMARPSFLGLSRKASIRSNNPGAMWPGPSSRKFGALSHQALNDGLGQGNKIAIFDDAIAGAAALFDLWDRVYAGKTLRAAIKKWSGGNNIQSYLTVMRNRAQIEADTVITKEMLRDPEFGIRLAKAMAWHEAGEEFPLTDEHWRQAHSEAFLLPPIIEKPERKEVKKVLAQSTKRKVTKPTKWSLFGGGGFALIMAKWNELKAFLGVGSDMFDTAATMATSIGWLGLGGLLIIVAIIVNWLDIKQEEDYLEGRYIPSGSEES